MRVIYQIMIWKKEINMEIDLFGDERKIPSVKVNVKVKIDTDDQNYIKLWNIFFGYIMKKPRTKLEFLAVSKLRQLNLSELTVEKLKKLLTAGDYMHLKKIEYIFDNLLTNDLKAFILAILKIHFDDIKYI